MNPDTQNNPWPGGMQPIGELELWTVKVMAAAEPLFYLLAILLFLAGTVLLVLKTRAAGRFLILAGTSLCIAYGMYYWATFPSLENGLLHAAIGRVVPATSILLVVAGYVRLAWWLFRKKPAA